MKDGIILSVDVIAQDVLAGVCMGDFETVSTNLAASLDPKFVPAAYYDRLREADVLIRRLQYIENDVLIRENTVLLSQFDYNSCSVPLLDFIAGVKPEILTDFEREVKEHVEKSQELSTRE